MSHEELGFCSAVELAAMMRRRAVSPVEVMRATLARIERFNPALNAFVTVQSEEAMCSAAKAEDALMRGECWGPLHGVPLHVKDNLFVAGSRTTFGSKLTETNVTTEDCPAVERLRQAGMIVVGRTNTPEQGWKGVTDNRVFGITRNPWNAKLTPGGSSGGASAAVAAGLGPIGLGTDGGDRYASRRHSAECLASRRASAAFRIGPAAAGQCCGTSGRSLARWPTWPSRLDVLAGPDPRDLLSLPATGECYSVNLDCGLRGKRIAFSPNLGYARVDPEVAAICQRAAGRFAEAGAIVEPVQLDWRVRTTLGACSSSGRLRRRSKRNCRRTASYSIPVCGEWPRRD